MKHLYILLLSSLFTLPTFAVKTEESAKLTTTLAEGNQFLSNQQTAFEENKGQVTGEDGPKVKFTFQSGGLSIFLMPTGISYQFNKTHYPEGFKYLDKFAIQEEQEEMDKLADKIRLETYRMNVTLVGANSNAKITTEGKSEDYIQYYNHNALDVHSYSKVTYHDIYPNIDWVIYKNGETIKYDFVVHPGGDPEKIKLETTHAENIELDEKGNLILTTSMGAITENKPVSFQSENEIITEFELVENVLTFNVDGYNKTEDLVIDPVLGWATYFGGSGGDYGTSCSVDDSGNVYMVGSTGSTTSIASGGHQNTHGGANTDAVIVKFSSSGTRLWASYYGGIATDGASFCAVDDSGNVYICGSTNSTTNIALGGYQDTIGGGGLYGSDAFLVKFNSSGLRLWATYYGGINPESGYGCKVDDSGNVYLVGATKSIADISSGGHQSSLGGNYDAFIVKFSSAGARLWATYYGGGSNDFGYSCALDDSGNLYIAGGTSSYSNISSGGHQNNYGGGTTTSSRGDGFLVKFTSSGLRLWATYYGGSATDQARSCAVDGSGNVYLAGRTKSNSNIASSGYQNSQLGSEDAFLVKFSSIGVRLWATYYGGTGIDGAMSCAADYSGVVYLSGFTTSYNHIASGGYQNVYQGGGPYGGDAFLAKFSPLGARLWGTYYGGAANDEGAFCAVGDSGIVYFGGYTGSATNIASGGYQNTFGGTTNSGDAFLAKFYCGHNVVDSQTACNAYTWINGVTYTTSNNSAKDTLLNASGCDSVINLNLTINNANTGTDVITACNDYTWINGVTYSTSTNTEKDTLINVFGCDSTVTLNLTVFYSNTGIDTQIVCDSYTSLNGTTWVTSGIYQDTLTNVNGCDSIVTLHLTINNSIAVIDTQSACNSYTWVNGVTYYTNNNTAVDTLIGSLGCDSIITLNLSINVNESIDTISTCNSYTWINGITYTNGNTTARDTLVNALGCDSVITLNLTIRNSNTGIDAQIACNSYTWINGVTYNSTNNTAKDTLINAFGCDSIVTLDLTINYPSTGVDTITACNQYTWVNGVTYLSSNNTATHALTNSNGCDSVITLNLMLGNSNIGTDIQVACNSYTWIDGITYTTSNNTATDTLTNTSGCDSIITLNLTINSNTGTDIINTCNSYTWINGITYTTSNNTATDTLINANGCDSILTLNLTINHSTSATDVQTACDNFTWIDGITYTANNNIATFTMTNTSGCDSIITLNLTINSIDISVIVNTHTISANQSGATYQWLDCSSGFSIIANETNFSYTATISGSYAVKITINGCTDTSSCITLTDVGITEPNFGSDFKIYPNPTQGKISISLGNSYQNITVHVFNSVGQIIDIPIKNESTDYIEFEITGERGVYFIQIQTEQESGLWKVVKD